MLDIYVDYSFSGIVYYSHWLKGFIWAIEKFLVMAGKAFQLHTWALNLHYSSCIYVFNKDKIWISPKRLIYVLLSTLHTNKFKHKNQFPICWSNSQIYACWTTEIETKGTEEKNMLEFLQQKRQAIS